MYAQLQQRGSPRPPVNVSTLQKMKAEGEKISSLTAYDASFAALVDEAEVDVVLVAIAKVRRHVVDGGELPGE